MVTEHLNRTPPTHTHTIQINRNNTYSHIPLQTHTHAQTKQNTYTHAHKLHTICTHTEHRTQNTTIMQHIQDNTDNREQDTGATENTNTPQHRTVQNTEYTSSAHNYRTYSLDYYNEYVAIKNNDTIELYTILKE